MTEDEREQLHKDAADAREKFLAQHAERDTTLVQTDGPVHGG